MMILLMSFFLLFGGGEFVGVFLYLVLFIVFLTGFSAFGADLIKSDLFGVIGLDYVSYCLNLLVLWLISLVLMLFYDFLVYFLMLGLLVSMVMMFMSVSMLYLFIYFEFSMLPMFLIIMFFGGSKERYMASVYMFIYTMASSLPMLVVLMVMGEWSGSMNMDYMSFNSGVLDVWVCIVLVFMFLVKVPMFMVHVWLPKAHVEAPVFGSMVLASIMLKMGGYGVIRCMDVMEVDVFVFDFFFCFCLCGCLVFSYICLFQVDLKVLVAYSSIIHMGMMLLGLFSASSVGYLGGIIIMLSHGICSSGMFYLVNEIYGISGSRLLLLNKGLMGVGRVLIWMWLGMLINNLGVPPCFGILGEVMLISGCLSYFFCGFFYFFLIILFISCFVVGMFVGLVSGSFMGRYLNVGVLTYFGVGMHLIPLNFFIFFMSGCF